MNRLDTRSDLLKPAKKSKSAKPAKSSMGWRDRWARNRFINLLSNLSVGQVTLVTTGGREVFGSTADGSHDQSDRVPSAADESVETLAAIVTIHREAFFRKSLAGPVAIADSYVKGDWDCDDLTMLIRIFLQNRAAINRSHHWRVRLANYGYRIFHWLNSNTRRGSLRNIQAHYDLGNDFYRLWLDETMAYSSGVFLHPEMTLQEASEEKFDRICRKLHLQSDDEVLEIGTGFGGFALHAAEQWGCHVTTTTISSEQYEFAQSRVAESAAGERVSLLKQDYRDLSGKYDKLVSIEMIEAVGHRFLDQFFERCSDLLKRDGSLVLQAIVMPEKGYDRYLNSVDFIQRYVFPGGCLPSLAAILESVGRTSDLRFVHAEDMAPHYAETLRHWRSAFESRLDEVRQQGYSEELIRLWRFYLCYCEAAFDERRIGVLQIQFDKPGRRHDPIQIGHRAAEHGRRSEANRFEGSPSKRDAIAESNGNGFGNSRYGLRQDGEQMEKCFIQTGSGDRL